VAAAEWMQAVLFDGLGQYQAAFATAQGAVESWKELTITTALALVELVTAAARTGRPDIAVEADRRLAEITEASGHRLGTRPAGALRRARQRRQHCRAPLSGGD